MKTLNWNSKFAQSLMKDFKKSDINELSQCYTRHSTRKECAYRECVRQCVKEGGYGFRIISYNSFYFTCGWLVSHLDGNEFIGTHLRIETPHNSYIIEDYLPF